MGFNNEAFRTMMLWMSAMGFQVEDLMPKDGK